MFSIWFVVCELGIVFDCVGDVLYVGVLGDVGIWGVVL